MELHLDSVVDHLKRLKEKDSKSYELALNNLVRSLLVKEGSNTEPFLVKLLEALDEKGIDLTALREEIAKLKSERDTVPDTGAQDVEAFTQALKQQIPNLKTQVQLDLTTNIFMAIQQYLNAAFGNEEENARAMRQGLDQALDLAMQLGALTETLKDIPEATTNKAFVDPPFDQEVIQRQLLSELAKLETKELFNQWYRANKTAFDNITDPSLRNELYDAIRKQRTRLAS